MKGRCNQSSSLTLQVGKKRCIALPIGADMMTSTIHILFCEMNIFSNKLSSFSAFFLFNYHLLLIQMKSVLAVALVASASAFVPAQNARMPTKLNFEYGEYDDKLWDQDAKKDVYNKWDPSAPRSTRNFNPFETFKGNSPDASGIYSGEVSA